MFKYDPKKFVPGIITSKEDEIKIYLDKTELPYLHSLFKKWK